MLLQNTKQEILNMNQTFFFTSNQALLQRFNLQVSFERIGPFKGYDLERIPVLEGTGISKSIDLFGELKIISFQCL